MDGTNDWQPIETAPKDGTGVLLFSPRWAMVVGFWHEGDDGRGWAMPVREDGYMPLGRMASPTHWQPLPEPPK